MASYTMLVTVLCLMSMSMVQGVHLEDALRSAFYRVFDNNAPSDKRVFADRGVVKSCGPPDANFSVEWEPKVIDPEGHVTVYYDYTTPHDFNSGKINVALYMQNIPDPIFEETLDVDCDNVKKYTGLPCPMKKGVTLKGQKTISNLMQLKDHDDTYKAKAQLTNEKGEILFCAEIVLTVKG